MAYQNLTLRNIAGEITAQFNDGSFRSLTPPDPSSGETAAFIGTASSGVTHEFFRHVDIGRTFTEFGADSEIARMVQAAKASDEELPVIVSRIGARNASMTLKRAITDSHELENILRIVPKFVQEAGDRGRLETLEALKVVLVPYVEGNFPRQRVLLGLESASGVVVPVYDSERLLVADGESIFDVEINLPVGEILYTEEGLATSVKNAAQLNSAGGGVNTWAGQAQADRLSSLAQFNDVVEFEWADALRLSDALIDKIFLLGIYGVAAKTLIDATTPVFSRHAVTGQANKALSNKSQRYVGVDLAYQNMQFEDVGYIYCEGCHADTECVEIDDIAEVTDQLLWPHSKLGNLWKFEYNGREYSYMFGRKDAFNVDNVDDYEQTLDDPGSRASLEIDGITLVQDAVGVDVTTFRLTVAEANDPAVGDGGAADLALVKITNVIGSPHITVTNHADGVAEEDDIVVTKGDLVKILNGEAVDGIFVVDAGGFLQEGGDHFSFSAQVAAADASTALTADLDDTQTFANGRAAGNFDIEINLTDEQKKLGDLLNLVDFHFDGSQATTKVESVPNDEGRIDCFVEYQASSAGGVTIQTPFANIEFSAHHGTFVPLQYGHRLRPSKVGGAATLSTTLLTSEKMVGAAASSEHDPFVMTHHDLTGEFVPEGVLARILDFVEDLDGATASPATLVASKDEIREISFLQQAAQAAYSASTNYSQCIAVVPTSAPSNSDRGLQNWAGQPATYEVNSQGELKVSQDGTGILGMKLLAGRSDYRGGSAFGGIMLTEGNNLPNEKPYGIDDSDEAKDAYGEPIDLGKHVLVVGAYGITPDPESRLNRRRVNQSGGVYTNAGPKICGILNSLAPGNEPIGQVNGRVTGMIPRHRTSMATLNNLALIRVCMIDQNSVISSIYTAAQPNSDYRKISSIMSSNAILKQLRDICMPYVGRPFKDEEIASLTQTIDGAMKQMVSQNFAQSINVSLSASRLDRINGVLRASVRFVPPLSIEAITVEITLEPPAAGL